MVVVALGLVSYVLEETNQNGQRPILNNLLSRPYVNEDLKESGQL